MYLFDPNIIVNANVLVNNILVLDFIQTIYNFYL